MIPNLPIYISVVFVLTTLATLFLFIRTVRSSGFEATRKKSGLILIGLTAWLILQAALTLNGFYNKNLLSLPPKLMLFGILPAVLVIILLFLIPKGRDFIDSLPIKNITYLNVVRIPVEIVLLWLFISKAVPELMTFEGRNFDILSGISAPVIAYFVFTKKNLSRNILLIWNFICLGFLVNIVINALLSAPFPLQQFAFDQPNIAIINFPFSWLPTFIVPIVLFGHLVSIRQLIKR
ncbi:hypothetical protein [Epilithonimonas sp. UC225_85]|uniref:hypothetical protein n=1 Tax=Epilithonimonas sp. UC225_85 TaxID=3350167 RepID=UPI0036D2198E